MMKTIMAALIAIVATSCGCGSPAHGAPPTITVTAQGVRVVKPPPGGDDTLRAFNDVSGTTVALLVTEPGGGLVVFDGDSSRVRSFVDDKGKDVTRREPRTKAGIRVPDSWVFGPVGTVSENHKYCSLEVKMPGIPTKQATTLTLSGTLVLKIAKEKKDFMADKVALHAGTRVNAGKIPLTIKRAGKPQFGGDDNPLEVEFHGTQNLDAITRIRFFDATGKEIEAGEAGRSCGRSWGGGSAPSDYDAAIAYRLKGAADTAKIVITYWTDMKEVAVPFNLKVTLGL
jgi:hypothetical protein